MYKQYRNRIIDNLVSSGEPVNLVGDERCDSPGYSAKYGTYTLADTKSGEIIDFYICHSLVAGNSSKMEKKRIRRMFVKNEQI